MGADDPQQVAHTAERRRRTLAAAMLAAVLLAMLGGLAWVGFRRAAPMFAPQLQQLRQELLADPVAELKTSLAALTVLATSVGVEVKLRKETEQARAPLLDVADAALALVQDARAVEGAPRALETPPPRAYRLSLTLDDEHAVAGLEVRHDWEKGADPYLLLSLTLEESRHLTLLRELAARRSAELLTALEARDDLFKDLPADFPAESEAELRSALSATALQAKVLREGKRVSLTGPRGAGWEATVDPPAPLETPTGPRVCQRVRLEGPHELVVFGRSRTCDPLVYEVWLEVDGGIPARIRLSDPAGLEFELLRRADPPPKQGGAAAGDGS